MTPKERHAFLTSPVTREDLITTIRNIEIACHQAFPEASAALNEHGGTLIRLITKRADRIAPGLAQPILILLFTSGLTMMLEEYSMDETTLGGRNAARQSLEDLLSGSNSSDGTYPSGAGSTT